MIPNLSTDLARVAATLFAHHGYVATTTREVARHLKVDVATVFYHYKTKGDLLQAVLAPLFATLLRAVASARAEPDDVVRRDALVATLIEAQAAHPNAAKVWLDPSVSQAKTIARKRSRLDDEIVELLDQSSNAPPGRAAAALGAIRGFPSEALATEALRAEAAAAVLRLIEA